MIRNLIIYICLYLIIVNDSIESRRNDNSCGTRPMDLVRVSRIVGGRDAFYGEVPWQVLIKESTLFGFWNYNKCGGVLIHHKWVITAAHCNSGLFGSLHVILGEHNLKTANDSAHAKSAAVVRKASRVVIHPKYNPQTLENDLALIELDSSVQYEHSIQAICLPHSDHKFANSEGYVSGWGVLSFEKPMLPEVMQIVSVPILSNEKCQIMYKTAKQNIAIKKSFLCAGYALGGKDSCEGDSGGPLMVRYGPDGVWMLAGIVSNGIKCAEPNLPGIYTRISDFTKWITDTISTNT